MSIVSSTDYMDTFPATSVNVGMLVGHNTMRLMAMVAAAESGQGVAIARRTLVVDAIAEGRLVRPFAPIADDGEGYFLVTTPAARHSSTVQAFSDWLQGEVQRIETR